MAKKPRRVEGITPLSGDLIRAIWHRPDHVRTVEGRVGAVIYNGTERTFKSVNGEELYTWVLGSPGNPIVELLDAVPTEQEPLPGL